MPPFLSLQVIEAAFRLRGVAMVLHGYHVPRGAEAPHALLSSLLQASQRDQHHSQGGREAREAGDVTSGADNSAGSYAGALTDSLRFGPDPFFDPFFHHRSSGRTVGAFPTDAEVAAFRAFRDDDGSEGGSSGGGKSPWQLTLSQLGACIPCIRVHKERRHDLRTTPCIPHGFSVPWLRPHPRMPHHDATRLLPRRSGARWAVQF